MNTLTQPTLTASEDLDTTGWYEVSADMSQFPDLPELPTGYGFIGGTARAIAQATLFGEAPTAIRDLDIVSFEELNPDLSRADDLAKEHMPDDYAHSFGVYRTSLADYFGTRDFTINEVAVVGGKILISDQAESDLFNKVIRPTEHETRVSKGKFKNRIAARALLLQSVLETQSRHADLEDIDIGPISYFHMALGLNKALQHGPETAERFMSKLKEYGLLNDIHQKDPVALAFSLAGLTTFSFRNNYAMEKLERYERTPVSYLIGAMDDEGIDAHTSGMANAFGGRGAKYVGKYEY